MWFIILLFMPLGAWALLLLIILVAYLIRRSSPMRRRPKNILSTDTIRNILSKEILFYQNLDADSKKLFLSRVEKFLNTIRITGVGTTVEETDRVMIGASAIIPIFHFPGWQYINVNEVLLYPDTFDEDFRQKGEGRSVLGMVGSGNMQYEMVLSKSALREGFRNNRDKSNTGIHEFVHLVDKTDGTVDGVPEVLVNHQMTGPWIRMMHDQILEIRKGKSDINPYGASNQSEFLAVVAEYFFERPDLLQHNHPELYAILDSMFNPAPAK
ncbi:MAG: M90 family metallopeptidase [Chitinophagaceae bacterium]